LWQVEENLRIAGEAEAGSLTDDELALIERVKQAYWSLPRIDCSGCGYCAPCPFGVDIPGNFNMYNGLMTFNDRSRKPAYFKQEEKARASACRACGKCESVCPQRLPIRELLRKVAEAMAD
jgi:predicted aldo/keto reductase-like oxidoreductase